MTRTARRLPLLLGAVLAASCVDAAGPVGPEVHLPVDMALAPTFAWEPAPEQVATLERIRATGRDAATGEVLARAERSIDPTASSWVVELTVGVPSGQVVNLVVDVELASLPAGAESVEWSGRTSSFQVRAGQPPQDVRVVKLLRGPLANLDVRSVSLAGPSALVQGEEATLAVQLDGGGEGTRAFFSTLDPEVVTVDASGRISALGAGTGRVVAEAGPAADTLVVPVSRVVLPEPSEVRRLVSPQLDFTTGSVVGTLADAAGAARIGEALSALSSALVGGDPGGAVVAFDQARAGYREYGGGDPAIRAQDGPQLGLVLLALIHAADALGISFE